MRIAGMALILCLAAPVAQANMVTDYAAETVEKLAFGVVDVVYSPAEIPITVVRYAADFDVNSVSPIMGGFLGVPVGVGQTVFRAIRGAAGIVTFPIAPAKYRTFDWTISHRLPLSQVAGIDYDAY